MDKELQDAYARARAAGILGQDPELANAVSRAVKAGILQDLSGGSVKPAPVAQSSAPSVSQYSLPAAGTPPPPPTPQPTPAASTPKVKKPGVTMRQPGTSTPPPGLMALGRKATPAPVYDAATEAAIAQVGQAVKAQKGKAPTYTQKPMQKGPKVAPTLDPLRPLSQASDTIMAGGLPGLMDQARRATAPAFDAAVIGAVDPAVKAAVALEARTGTPESAALMYQDYLDATQGDGGAAGRAFSGGLVPAAGSYAGFSGGATLGAQVPGSPIVKAAGGLIGGMAGAMGGGATMAKIQEWADKGLLTPQVYDLLVKNRAKEQEQNKTAVSLGQAATALPFADFRTLLRAPLGERAMEGGVEVLGALGENLVTGKPMDFQDMVIQALSGAALPGENRLGRVFTGSGERIANATIRGVNRVEAGGRQLVAKPDVAPSAAETNRRAEEMQRKTAINDAVVRAMRPAKQATGAAQATQTKQLTQAPGTLQGASQENINDRREASGTNRQASGAVVPGGAAPQVANQGGALPAGNRAAQGNNAPAPAQAPATQQQVAPRASTQAPGLKTELIAPEDLGMLPGIQYKRGVDKSGVTDLLKGQKDYETEHGGTLTAFRDEKGNLYAVDGHHRRELAQRAARFTAPQADGSRVEVERKLSVQVLDAADGWKEADARAFGVLKNLRENKGVGIDAADALVKSLSPDAARSEAKKLPQTPLAREVAGLVLLDEGGRALVRNKQVDGSVAAAIGEVLRGDVQRQRVALEQAMKTDGVRSYDDGAALAKAVMDEDIFQKQDNQGSMFGDDEVGGSTFQSTAGEQAAIRGVVKKRLAAEQSSLLAVDKTEARTGEVFDVEGRRQEAGAVKDAKSKADALFDFDPEVKATLRQTAADVANGRISRDEGAKRVREVVLKNGSATLAEIVKKGNTAPAAPATPEPAGGGLFGDEPAQAKPVEPEGMSDMFADAPAPEPVKAKAPEPVKKAEPTPAPEPSGPLSLTPEEWAKLPDEEAANVLRTRATQDKNYPKFYNALDKERLAQVMVVYKEQDRLRNNKSKADRAAITRGNKQRAAEAQAAERKEMEKTPEGKRLLEALRVSEQQNAMLAAGTFPSQAVLNQASKERDAAQRYWDASRRKVEDMPSLEVQNAPRFTIAAPGAMEATRDPGRTPWYVQHMNGEEPRAIVGAVIRDNSVNPSERELILFGTTPGTTPEGTSGRFRLVVPISDGEPARRARQIVWGIGNARAESVRFNDLQRYINDGTLWGKPITEMTLEEYLASPQARYSAVLEGAGIPKVKDALNPQSFVANLEKPHDRKSGSHVYYDSLKQAKDQARQRNTTEYRLATGNRAEAQPEPAPTAPKPAQVPVERESPAFMSKMPEIFKSLPEGPSYREKRNRLWISENLVPGYGKEWNKEGWIMLRPEDGGDTSEHIGTIQTIRTNSVDDPYNKLQIEKRFYSQLVDQMKRGEPFNQQDVEYFRSEESEVMKEYGTNSLDAALKAAKPAATALTKPEPVEREAPAPSVPIGRKDEYKDFLTGKQVWELTPDEISKSLEFEKTRGKQIEDEILGDQAANWRKAQNMSNSMDSRRAAEGDKAIKEIESNLTQEQVDRLYGMGESGVDTETLQELKRDYSRINDSENAEELGRSIGRDLVTLKGKTDMDAMSHSQKLALARVHYASGIATEEGWDFQDVLKAALESASKQFGSAGDFAELMGDYLKLLKKPEGKAKPESPAPVKQEAKAIDAPAPDVARAVRDALRKFTMDDGRLQPERLAGPGMQEFRQSLMQNILGRKVTKTEATVTNALKAIADLAGVKGDLFRLDPAFEFAKWMNQGQEPTPALAPATAPTPQKSTGSDALERLAASMGITETEAPKGLKFYEDMPKTLPASSVIHVARNSDGGIEGAFVMPTGTSEDAMRVTALQVQEYAEEATQDIGRTARAEMGPGPSIERANMPTLTYSKIQSVTVATDADGNISHAISQNGKRVAPIGTDEAKAISGDMEAFGRVKAKEAATVETPASQAASAEPTQDWKSLSLASDDTIETESGERLIITTVYTDTDSLDYGDVYAKPTYGGTDRFIGNFNESDNAPLLKVPDTITLPEKSNFRDGKYWYRGTQRPVGTSTTPDGPGRDFLPGNNAYSDHGLVGYDEPVRDADALNRFSLFPDHPGVSTPEVSRLYGGQPEKQTSPPIEVWRSFAAIKEVTPGASTPPASVNEPRIEDSIAQLAKNWEAPAPGPLSALDYAGVDSNDGLSGLTLGSLLDSISRDRLQELRLSPRHALATQNYTDLALAKRNILEAATPAQLKGIKGMWAVAVVQDHWPLTGPSAIKTHVSEKMLADALGYSKSDPIPATATTPQETKTSKPEGKPWDALPDTATNRELMDLSRKIQREVPGYPDPAWKDAYAMESVAYGIEHAFNTGRLSGLAEKQVNKAGIGRVAKEILNADPDISQADVSRWLLENYGKERDNEPSSSADLERDSQNPATSNAMGAEGVPAQRPADNRGAGGGVLTPQEPGDSPYRGESVPSTEAAPSGGRRNKPVRDAEPRSRAGATASTTGSDEPARSSNLGLDGLSPEPVSAGAVSRASSEGAGGAAGQSVKSDIPLTPIASPSEAQAYAIVMESNFLPDSGMGFESLLNYTPAPGNEQSEWFDKYKKAYLSITEKRAAMDQEGDEFRTSYNKWSKSRDNFKMVAEAAVRVDKYRESASPQPLAADSFAALVARQKAAESVPVKLQDIDNIRETLPVLKPAQQDDVLFAENRFAAGKEPGVLFTNGTGTGKTYTALGIVKRFERQGKKSILIVAPNAEIIDAWIVSAPNLNLSITRLDDTKEAGEGIVVTTYANLSQNLSLGRRNWDLVIADEAHTLMSNKEGGDTLALDALQAITLHPRGVLLRTEMLYPEISGPLAAARAERLAAENNTVKSADGEESIVKDVERFDKAQADVQRLANLLDEKRKIVRADVEARQAERTKVVFLSATPFSYEKTTHYAEGYLFSYPKEDGSTRTGYNIPTGRNKFMVDNFGWSMKTNLLTQPSAEVDRALLQREFNNRLKREGALSGRALDVPFDYDRKFILAESSIGTKIDQGLKILWEDDYYRPLWHYVQKKFGFLEKRYLLEALKAREAIPIIRQHLAMGRKVVLFHDYNKGGTDVSPFDMSAIPAGTTVQVPDIGAPSWSNRTRTVLLSDIAAKFAREYPEFNNMPLGRLKSPIEAVKEAFPDVLQINGIVKKREAQDAVRLFQDDTSGRNLVIVQSAKGAAGISLHDTTGKHQRVLINLGMPLAPTTAIQEEGRIFRVGQASNAIIRYITTGTNWERGTFAQVASKSGEAENLALGEGARALRDQFIQAYMDADTWAPGHEGEGTGGKEADMEAMQVTSAYDRAKTYYFQQQKKTSRTKAQEGIDYFATPEPIGFKMVEWLDPRKGEALLEPSGGHGAIARWFPLLNERTLVEPSAELSTKAMAAVPDARVIQGRFEDLHIVNKYHGIAMNPPFGQGGKTAIEHLEKAWGHLENGGRIVALLPTGPAADKRFDKWMNETRTDPIKPLAKPLSAPDGIYKGDTVTGRQFSGSTPQTGKVVSASSYGGGVEIIDDETGLKVNLYKIDKVEPTGPRTAEVPARGDAAVVAKIKLPSVTFERAGTSVSTHIVILEKRRDYSSPTREIDLTDITEIKELFDELENLGMGRRDPRYVKSQDSSLEKPVASPAPAQERSSLPSGFRPQGGRRTPRALGMNTDDELLESPELPMGEHEAPDEKKVADLEKAIASAIEQVSGIKKEVSVYEKRAPREPKRKQRREFSSNEEYSVYLGEFLNKEIAYTERSKAWRGQSPYPRLYSAEREVSRLKALLRFEKNKGSLSSIFTKYDKGEGVRKIEYVSEIGAAIHEADKQLSPPAQEAISSFVGHFVDEEGSSFMSPSALYDSVKSQGSVYKEVRDKIQPIKNKIAAQYGDAITLYRAQSEEGLSKGDAPALSYTSSPEYAKSRLAEIKYSGGNGSIIKEVIPLSSIVWITDRANQQEFIVLTKSATTEPSSLPLTTNFDGGELGAPIAPYTARVPISSIPWDRKPLRDPMSLINQLADATGKAVLFGKTKRGTAGTYRPADARIRIRQHGNVETTLHEIGHALDDDFRLVADYSAPRQHSPWDAELFQQELQTTAKTGMSLKMRRAEAVAEYMRLYAVNPGEARALAPTFTDHVEKTLPPAVLKAFESVGTEVRRLQGAPATEAALMNIQWGEGDARTIREKLTEALTGSDTPGVFGLSVGDKLTTNLQDYLRPVVAATEWAQKLTGASNILPEKDPILLMRLHSDTVGKVGQMLDTGFVDARGEAIIDPDTGEAIGGLDWLVKPLLRPSVAESERLMKLAAVKGIAERTLERSSKLTQGEFKTGIGLGLWSDSSTASAVLNELASLDPATQDDIDEGLRRYRLVANAMLDYMVDSGRMTRSDAQAIKDANNHYISLQRVMEDAPLFEGAGKSRRLATVAAPIKKAKGSVRQIRDPFVSLLDQTYKIVAESDRSKAMDAFIDLFRSDRELYEGDVLPLSQVASLAEGPIENRTVKVFHQGAEQYWEINDPDVYKALKGLGTPAAPTGPLKVLAALAARVPRALITGNPAFAVRNISRDMPERWIKSEFDSLPWESFKKFSQEEKARYALSGGTGMGFYGASRQRYAKAIKQVVKAASKSGTIIRLPSSGALESYQKLLQSAEIQGRLPDYARAFTYAKDKLGYDDYNAGLYAAGKARGLMDFAVAGNYLRAISPYIPFVNASVQGFTANYKALRRNPKKYLIKFLMLAAAKSLPLVLLASMGASKLEEYRSLPAYQRDLCINLPLPWADGWLSIPVGFEAASAASGIERSIDRALGNKDAYLGYFTPSDAPEDENYLMKLLHGSLAQSILPVKEEALLGPGGVPGAISEIKSNYDTFRQRNIVPQWEVNLPLSERKGAASASRAGQLLGKALSADPRAVDHFIQSVGGGTGTIATTLSNAGREDKPITGTRMLGMATGIVKEGPGYGAPKVQQVLRELSSVRVAAPPVLNRAQEELREARTPAELEEAKRNLRAAVVHPTVAATIHLAEARRDFIDTRVEAIKAKRVEKGLAWNKGIEARIRASLGSSLSGRLHGLRLDKTGEATERVADKIEARAQAPAGLKKMMGGQ